MCQSDYCCFGGDTPNKAGGTGWGQFSSLTASGKKLFFIPGFHVWMLHDLTPAGRRAEAVHVQGGGISHDAGCTASASSDVNVRVVQPQHSTSSGTHCAFLHTHVGGTENVLVQHRPLQRPQEIQVLMSLLDDVLCVFLPSKGVTEELIERLKDFNGLTAIWSLMLLSLTDGAPPVKKSKTHFQSDGDWCCHFILKCLWNYCIKQEIKFWEKTKQNKTKNNCTYSPNM